jgi:hypothetical protein
MTAATTDPTFPVSRPDGISTGEAAMLLSALARVKARRFGRLVVTVSDARIVDVEVVEKIDRDTLKGLSM